VNQTSDAIPNSPPLSTPERLFWAALILATLCICYFHNLGAIGLVGPDEPRYAWIARDMAETGDWVTPRLYGKPWFEKPPLYYWGAALSFKLFGVSEAAARLPSAVCALLATLALAWLASRLYGDETARWLILLLPNTVGMIGFSHAAATDMPFAAMLTIAMVFAAGILDLVPSAGFAIYAPISSFYSNTRPAGVVSLFLFGIFLGLATLAKGPAAIILSGGAVLLWATFTRRWRDAFRCLHPIAIAAFCLTALPWYILCARRNPDFFRVFIIEHNFKRFLTPEFQHIQPFWYYVPILLIAFLPWTLALLWSILYGTFRFLPARSPSPLTLLLLCWSGFCLLFFSLSKSKLPGYILPAIPAVALLLTRSITSLAPVGERSFRWLLAFFSILTCLTAAGVLWFVHANALLLRSAIALISVACVLLLFGLANFLLGNKGSRNSTWRFAAPLCVIPVLVLAYAFHSLAAPWLRYDPSGKTLAREIQQNHIPVEQLYVQPMRRGQQFSLNYYLGRETQNWNRESPKEGYLLLRGKFCASEVKPPWTCVGNPIELSASGWFVYRVQRDDSASGPDGSAGSSNRSGSSIGGDRSNLNNRQPR